MKRAILLLFSLFLFFSRQTFAQVIPASLITNWSKVGYSGTIPNPTKIINVKNYGAYGDSIHDDYTAIMRAINSSSQARVIYFPKGKYLIASTISLPAEVVLRGEGTKSQLIFSNASGHCIDINKSQRASSVSVTSGHKKDSKTITVSDVSGFIVDGYAEIRERNGAWNAHPAGETGYDVGQIIKITAISGKKLSLKDALRIDYDSSLNPQIRPVKMKTNVGIECLQIKRIKASTTTRNYNTINFTYAYNCWVKGVEGITSQKAHVYIGNSGHITVSDSYFHDAFSFGGGGSGYGVELGDHTSDCKVENNILHTLRHAMMAHNGANGNVFAYNYSFDVRSTTEIPRDAIGDISLHGYYAYANLFEGNIVQNIFADDYWGPSGPYNTFFRNRAELYGIAIEDQYNWPVKSDRQNVVGNEITNTGTNTGNYVLYGSNHFTYGNNVKGVIMPSGTTTLNDKSYYLSQQPSYWNISNSWPSIGIPNKSGSGTNPAKERYLSGGSKIICSSQTNLDSAPKTTPEPTENAASKIFISAYPNPSSGQFSVVVESSAANEFDVIVTDMWGRAVQHLSVAANEVFYLGEKLRAGIYIIEAFADKDKARLKIVKTN